MGIEYYLVNLKDKEYYELGKGPWSKFNFHFFPKLVEKWSIKKEEEQDLFCMLIQGAWLDTPFEEDYEKEEYLKEIGIEIYNWCKSKNWNFEIWLDCTCNTFELYNKMTCTGSRYKT